MSLSFQNPIPEAGIALGSNMGNRYSHILAAIEFLKTLSLDGWIETAPFYETDPVNCPPHSPPFLNTVVIMRPRESAETLLSHLREFERQRGRPVQYERNAPRPLDLDILYFDQQSIQTSFLTLPHPRLHQRRFVLQPLCDLRPDLILPGFDQPVKALLSNLKSCETLRRVKNNS